MELSSIDLARRLVQFPSINPPGAEKPCIEYLSDLLGNAGLSVETYEFAPGRPSIVARFAGTGDGKPLCFSGHVDVVLLGEKPWSIDPFAGEIRDGKFFGRGSCDMKSGIAAFVTATLGQVKRSNPLKRGITLVITSGEETGCEGAFNLAKQHVLDSSELEPTSNRPVVAHKGSVRLRISTMGKAAHSAMPELGENAIVKVAHLIQQIESRDFHYPSHSLLGSPTATVTTIFGGQAVSLVPDYAGFTLDLRTLPEQHHAKLIADIRSLCGADASIEVVTDFKGFATEPTHPRLHALMDILEGQLGTRPEPSGAPYFTDASALMTAFDNVPTVVLGPGDTAQCHQTDEACPVGQIEAAFQIFSALIARLCH